MRLYTRSGSLKTYFGRKGEGPGEFSMPTTAAQLPSGQILVPDMDNTISRFSAEGEFIERAPRRFRDIYQIHQLPDNNEILVVGQRAQGEETGRRKGSSPLLHRFNLESEEVVKSFFPHPVPLGSYGNILFGIGRIAVADVFEDQIAVAFAPRDKLYFFDRKHGTPTDSVTIPFEHFRRLKDLGPGSETLSSQEIWDYSLKYSSINDVFWLRKDIILVQYWDLIKREPWTTQYNLAAVMPDGTLLFDIADTPRILTVDRETQELLFSDPEYEVENHWKIGRLRESALK